jgi:hypothetical protein
MPTLTANQTLRAPSQAATLSAPARFTAARTLPAPVHAFGLVLDPVWELSAAQVVQDGARHRLRIIRSPLPAEPRPPGVPAVPRPY